MGPSVQGFYPWLANIALSGLFERVPPTLNRYTPSGLKFGGYRNLPRPLPWAGEWNPYGVG